MLSQVRTEKLKKGAESESRPRMLVAGPAGPTALPPQHKQPRASLPFLSRAALMAGGGWGPELRLCTSPRSRRDVCEAREGTR